MRKLLLFLMASASGVAVFAARAERERPSVIEINRVDPVSAWPLMEPLTYDCEVASEPLPGGEFWSVWKAYHENQEAIIGRLVRDRERERFLPIAIGPGVRGGPRVIAFDARHAWFFWTQVDGDQWSVRGRRFSDGKLDPEQAVSLSAVNSGEIATARVGKNGIVVVWQAQVSNRMVIQARRYDGATWGEVMTLSEGKAEAFRPVVESAGEEAWVAWDEYRKPNYTVVARRVGATLGEAEQVSPSDAYAIKPELLLHDGEPWVTWVHTVDVVGGDAVIDQTNSAQVARRHAGKWELQKDAAGRSDLVSLDAGLLARMAPKPAATGGYLGDRRRPMLLAAGPDVWLAYERKSNEAGVTTYVTGQLVARRWSQGVWSELQSLTQGLLEYRSVSPEAVDGKWTFTASRLPREHRRIYEKVSVDVAAATPARDDRVEGWQPVQLPLRSEPVARREIQDRGRTLKLFWLDSHVHSALSADAEGEPDEILHYARDRSQLDVVCVQENDDLYDVPLTPSEYAATLRLARWASARGDLLALPGFEWTQMLPSDGADPARPNFWTSSFRNHRTVIYPLSGGPLLRFPENGNDITRLYRAVAQAGGAMHTQHQTFAISHDDVVEPAIEVTAGWGIYFLNPGRIHQALDEGYHKAFIGTSDSHRRNPGLGGGLTGVYAEDRTDRKILEAYRDRRVFATSGARVMIEARLNGVLMGREVPVTGPARLTLHVDSPRVIRRTILVSAGKEIATFPGEGKKALDLAQDANPSHGDTWYYWRVELEGPGTNYQGNSATAEGNLAWSSPLWAIRR